MQHCLKDPGEPSERNWCLNFELPDAKSLPGSEWERDVPRNNKSEGSEWPRGRRKFASPESGLKFCFNKMNDNLA